MHFIKKSLAPNSLTQLAEQHKTSKQAWNTLQNPAKSEVHINMLQQEQHSLCAYCERKINQVEDSHLEHIYPQSKYISKRFDYKNLIVSCNGGQCSDIDQQIYDGIKHNSCGHRKENDFLPEKFLNPVEQTDIADYFAYDIDTGKIQASDKHTEHANYTLDLLNLRSPRLNNERKNAYIASLKAIKRTPPKQHKARLQALLNAEKMPAFVSYLRYCYSKFL